MGSENISILPARRILLLWQCSRLRHYYGGSSPFIVRRIDLIRDVTQIYEDWFIEREVF